jgi:hypothetical protein
LHIAALSAPGQPSGRFALKLLLTFKTTAPSTNIDNPEVAVFSNWNKWKMLVPATDRVLSVRLLRGQDLRAPPGWGRVEPSVELRLGSARRVSKNVPGSSPAWHELHEFTLDVEATPRLHLTVSAGPPKASAVDAVAGALSGAANVASLGVLGSRGADELRLRGRAGGMLGRVPACAADAEVPSTFDAAFCGRAVVDLRDIERRCALAGGPVCDTLPLRDAISGSLVCVFEMRRLVAMPADDSAAVAAPTEDATPAPSRRDGLTQTAAADIADTLLPRREAVHLNGERKPKRFSCFNGSDISD